MIYWTLCCNRGLGAIDITKPCPGPWQEKTRSKAADREWSYVSYNHNRVFPELYEHGWRFNCTVHGDQNPPIPYHGKVYVHRQNAVLCFSANGKLPLVQTVDETVPGEIAERCRLLNRVAQALPVDVHDVWKLGLGGDAMLESNYQYRMIEDDWGTRPLQVAWLPPDLALAIWKDSPARVSKAILDLDYALPLGRLAGIPDCNQATVTLPGLARYWREAPKKTVALAADDPLQTKLVTEIERMLSAGHLRPGYHN